MVQGDEGSNGINTVGRIQDHLGNKYQTVQEMCAAYGISYQDFMQRIKSGQTKEEALTGTRLRINPQHQKLYEAYGAVYGSFLIKMQHSADRKQLLEHEYMIGKIDEPAYDYKGLEFPTAGKMCKSYGVGYSALRRRLNAGFSIKEALSTPYGSLDVDFKCGKCTYGPVDHFGKKYPTMMDMCWEYDISALLLIWGEVKGYDLQAILEKRCTPNFWAAKTIGRTILQKTYKRMAALFYRASRFDWDKKRPLLSYRLTAKLCNDDEDK